jgi:hypothetical protein
MTSLYRVRVARDDYLGTADEVLAFMRRAQGAPPGDARAYMRGVAERLVGGMGVTEIPTHDAEAFLLALAARRLIRIEKVAEPSGERVDPREALGDGPVVYGAGVNPDDVPE